MDHVDLFSGIGGFALAFDTIFYEQKNTHIFCDNDPFCQAVLKKHWPDAEIFGDIRTFTYTPSSHDRGDTRELSKENERKTKERQKKRFTKSSGSDCFLLTGGFPCQPFSQAGQRRGTEDDRHLWPEMLRVIRTTKPQWVIAENVRGILTIDNGMVFEQVCTDLEREGYSVQPFIIPAVALNAPHRRDRIWFVAHANTGQHRGRRWSNGEENRLSKIGREEIYGRRTCRAGIDATDSKSKRGERWNIQHRTCELNENDINASNSSSERIGRSSSEERRDDKRLVVKKECERCEIWRESKRRTCKHRAGKSHIDTFSIDAQGSRAKQNGKRPNRLRCGEDTGWEQNWLEVATNLCRVDDGIPKRLDRNPRLKALGNAIVPQVAMEIMKAIKSTI